MASKVLLIYPQIKTVVMQPPLSVLTLASVLKRDGFEVDLIDDRVRKDTKEAIKKSIESGNVISIGLSTMTGSQIRRAIALSKYIRSFSNIPIVYGGVHPTFLPEQTLKEEFIDFVVMGFGEKTFLKLNKMLESGKKDFASIDCLGYKEDGQIKINPLKFDKDFNLDELPPPAWELVDVKNYLEKGFVGKSTLTLIGSRGCPHRCAFCYSQSFFNRRWYARSAENVLNELDGLREKYDIDSVYFNDDNFVVDRKRMMAICKGLKERDIRYSIFSRAEYIDEELIKFLKDNNCVRMGVGAESGSQKILDMLKKDIKVEHLINVAELCNKYQIACFFSFMVGYPLETEEDMNMTLDLIDRLITINPLTEITDLKIMTPYPGTEFYNVAIEHGFKPPATLAEWGNFEWNKCNIPWIKDKRIYETMSFAVLLTFYTHRIKRGNIASNMAIDMLHQVEKLRWKKRYWKYGVETSLINYYLDKFA